MGRGRPGRVTSAHAESTATSPGTPSPAPAHLRSRGEPRPAASHSVSFSGGGSPLLARRVRCKHHARQGHPRLTYARAELLTAHPGLIALRGARPWLGPQLLKHLVEPQLADSLAAGMTPEQAIVTYRRLYLLTLGSASFVDHHPSSRPDSNPTRAGRPQPRGVPSPDRAHGLDPARRYRPRGLLWRAPPADPRRRTRRGSLFPRRAYPRAQVTRGVGWRLGASTARSAQIS
jgi:hypothetical protein